MVKGGSEYTIVDFEWFDDSGAKSNTNRQHLISRHDKVINHCFYHKFNQVFTFILFLCSKFKINLVLMWVKIF